MTQTRVFFVCVCACALALFGCSESFESGDGGGIVLMDGGGGTTDGGGGGGGMIDGGGGGTTDGGGGIPIDGGGAGVDCMGMTCGATQQCCVTRDPAGGGVVAECIGADTMCMGATADCDGPEDCGGADYCCARVDLGGVAIMCESPSTCVPGGFGPFEVCHTADDCSTPSDMCCPINMGGFTGAYCSAMCFGGAP